MDPARGRGLCLGPGLVRVGTDDTGELAGRRLQDHGDSRRRGLQQADKLAAKLIQRGQGGERLDSAGVEQRSPIAPPTMVSFSFALAYLTATFAAATGSVE